MSQRTITTEYVVHNLFEILKTTTDRSEAIAYRNSAAGFFDTVVIETRKVNR